MKLTKFSLLLGNLFEHYETALYALLSPFLAPLFFPEQDPITALILAYAIIPLGLFAKPLGALFFGSIGDKNKALQLSLSGMAIVSGGMALLPTYHQAGWLAPILLIIGRLLQSFFASGENIGGAIVLLENSGKNQQDLMSGIFTCTSSAGFLFASGAVSLLCFLGDTEHGWRLLYAIGCCTAIAGVCIRKGLPKQEGVEQQSLTKLWEFREIIGTIALAAGFSYATFSVAFVLTNGLVPLITDIHSEEMMHLGTLLLILDLLLLPLFGMAARWFSRTNMMIAAAFVGAVSAIPLFAALEGASLPVVIAVRVCFVIIGAWFSATFHTWSQNLVPTENRYPVISFGYAIGSQLTGAPTAAISLWMVHQSGVVWIAGLYLVVLGLCSGLAMNLNRRSIRNGHSLKRMTT